MKILVIGCGGREHAIIKNLVKNNEVYCVGEWLNPGIKILVKTYYVIEGLDKKQFQNVLNQIKPNMTFIGPEKYLVDGFSNVSWKNKCPCIGPIQLSTLIESSKKYARNLLWGCNISIYSPIYYCNNNIFYPNQTIDENVSVEKFIESVNEFVIKYDGLKGGKGVFVQEDHFDSKEEGLDLYKKCCKDGDIILEEKLYGEEFSLFTFSDGMNYQHSPPIKDFKRAYENNKGPNTGGMGSISVWNGENYLFNFLDNKDLLEAQKINELVLEKIREGDIGYIGILYGSFIKTLNGIKVIEFNCRFGDSEAINIIELLENDLGIVFSAMIREKLDQVELRWKKINTVVKYIVPYGYPVNPFKNKMIKFTGNFSNNMYVSSLDYIKDDEYNILGSRTIAFAECSDSLLEASKNCDLQIEKFTKNINENLFYWRKDIGILNNYQSCGVDINKGNLLVKNIKSIVESTYNSAVKNKHGAFAGKFLLKKSSRYNDDSVLVSSTDGVGTKSIVMYDYLKGDGLYSCGLDIVNHCINDILVEGAYPLFFLDYFAFSRLDINLAENFIKGCSVACKKADCVLIGGETAEMPGVYQPGRFDLVGTIVGIKSININEPKEGDVVISFNSIGPHTNGYSLIRKCLEIEEPPQKVLDYILHPHTSYLERVMSIVENFSDIITGMCHITGGGIENIDRILPDDLAIEENECEIPLWCKWIQKIGHIDDQEMKKVFNMGHGYLVFIDRIQYNDFKERYNYGFNIYGIIKKV